MLFNGNINQQHKFTLLQSLHPRNRCCQMIHELNPRAQLAPLPQGPTIDGGTSSGRAGAGAGADGAAAGAFDFLRRFSVERASTCTAERLHPFEIKWVQRALDDVLQDAASFALQCEHWILPSSRRLLKFLNILVLKNSATTGSMCQNAERSRNSG